MPVQKREKTKMEDTVVLKNCRSGLGMKICGGQNEDGSFTGIFVKKILIGGSVASDGTLEEGDEILSANGQSLQECSNDKAVAILRKAAQTGMVKIVYKRDDDSRIKMAKLLATNSDSLFSSMRQESMEKFANSNSLGRSDSLSSRVSTNSLEKRSWVYNGDRMSPAPSKEPHLQVDLHPNEGRFRQGALDLPLSPRGLEAILSDANQNHLRSNGIHKIKEQAVDLERASSFDSGLPSSGRFPSPDLAEIIDSMPVIKIDVPAKTNLGISITGGKNKPDGPHIYVKDVIEGCDAYLDGRIRKGDRIIAINQESFTDVTYEQARSILLRLKLQKDLSIYRIRYLVNPDQWMPLKQLPSSSPAPVNKRISEHPKLVAIPSTVDEQSQDLEASPNNVESLISQSSDEEAVIKELIKMMEKSGEYETQLINGSEMVPSTHYNPKRTIVESSERKNVVNHLEDSTSPERSVFNPSKYSSPEDKVIKDETTPVANGRKTISQYLQQDLNEGFSPKSTPNASNRASKTVRKSRGRRLSLDPTTKIKVEKLEVALNYLGYETTPSIMREVRRRVKVDPNGSVTYGDFVAAARQVLDLQLDDRTQTLNASTLQFAMRDIDELDRAEMHSKKPEVSESRQQLLPVDTYDQVSQRMSLQEIEALEQEQAIKIAKRESENFAEMQAPNRRIHDDLARVARERDDAIRQLQHLKRQLNEKNQNDAAAFEDQLDRSRQEVANAHREVNELRTRTILVSTALQGARQREQQHEETIEKLKHELESGKSKNNNIGPKQREFNELQKRLVVLGCQLRKTEVSKRTYEVAVEKLTKFAQHVQDTVENDKNSSRPNSRNSSVKKSRAPAPPFVDNLAQEARDTVRAVKLLLEEEPLPFGWEEVYSPDGTRYYINHVTQTTSWLHPVSGVQHAGAADVGNVPPPSDKKF